MSLRKFALYIRYFVISVANKQYKTNEISLLGLEKLVCYIRYFVISDFFILIFHCIEETHSLVDCWHNTGFRIVHKTTLCFRKTQNIPTIPQTIQMSEIFDVWCLWKGLSSRVQWYSCDTCGQRSHMKSSILLSMRVWKKIACAWWVKMYPTMESLS